MDFQEIMKSLNLNKENPVELKADIYKSLDAKLGKEHSYEVRVQDAFLSSPNKIRTITIYDMFDTVLFKESREINY